MCCVWRQLYADDKMIGSVPGGGIVTGIGVIRGVRCVLLYRL